MSETVLIVGAGNIAQEYAKVLLSLGRAFCVVGRSEESARSFKENIGIPVSSLSLEEFLSAGHGPTTAIVTTSIESLEEASVLLLNAGARRLLIEKPGALRPSGLARIKSSQPQGTEIYIAYNRRFYSSILCAEDLIRQEGGIQSALFEFTEWDHVIKGLAKPPEVKAQWFYANCTHVIDTVFFEIGYPDEMCSYASGGLSWHPTASIFSGAGRTERGVLFSYTANWGSAGRWSIEFCTALSRYILRPMEELQVMRKGSLKIEPVTVNGDLDIRFKPGFYHQTRAFLDGDTSRLCSLDYQLAMYRIYARMNPQ